MTTENYRPLEKHAEAIWHTTELLRNQGATNDEVVLISRGALQQCCKIIDSHLEIIVETLDNPTEKLEVNQ